MLHAKITVSNSEQINGQSIVVGASYTGERKICKMSIGIRTRAGGCTVAGEKVGHLHQQGPYRIRLGAIIIWF